MSAPGKVVPLAAAVAMVDDGATVATGGVLTTRKPLAVLDAIARSGRRDLTLWTMLGGLDVETLVARGALRALHAIYVGFEQQGFAPAYEAAVERGDLQVHEHSELTLIAGLRASMLGVPFLPTRGAEGSDVAAGLGLLRAVDPYSGEALLAVPALRPDVALLHAEAADAAGNVLGPGLPDFIFDLDASVARGSSRVVVSVERLADADEVERRRRDILLYAHEVDAIVVQPGGARPSALPGVYGVDLDAITAYLERARSSGPERAIEGLLTA